MRYDFSKMDADSFELMVRSLNEKVFGIKCEQFGLGPDGQSDRSSTVILLPRRMTISG